MLYRNQVFGRSLKLDVRNIIYDYVIYLGTGIKKPMRTGFFSRVEEVKHYTLHF